MNPFSLNTIEQKVQEAADRVKAQVKHEVLVEVHKVLLRNELAALVELEPDYPQWVEMLREIDAK